MNDTNGQSRLLGYAILFLSSFSPTRANSQLGVRRTAFLPNAFAAQNSIASNGGLSDIRPYSTIHFAHRQTSGDGDSNKLLLENRVQIGVVCQGGSDPKRPQKVNQDAYFHESFHLEKTKDDDERSSFYTCVGVLDGHGLKGHVVSNYIAQQLPVLFQYHMERLLGDNPADNKTTILTDLEEFEETLVRLGGLSPEDISSKNHPVLHQAMIKAFHSAQHAAMQDPDIPAGRNGATCVMVVLDHSDSTLHVAHVGDSRAIQVDVQEGVEVKASPLSLETTVKMEKEKQRVERGEGSIRGNTVFYGPVGIAMTRSLGNAVMLRAGVVPTPLVDAYPFSRTTQSESFLVLGTDGIWDVLSNHAVAEILAASDTSSDGDIQIVCDLIASAARKKWIGDLPIVDEETIDDITCIVVRVC